MPRAVWSGSLTFGLVSIPVRLYPATEPKDVRFHLVDRGGRRVRYRRFVQRDEPYGRPWDEQMPVPPLEGELEAPAARPEPRACADRDAAADETEVDFADLMRGYEIDEGAVVVLSREEIEAARPERSRTIEIEDFVDLADIDPVYYEKSYHLGPQRGAEKPYALLLRAIERSGRVGIGRFVLRTKPHLIAVRPADGVLGLETLFFGDEIRSGRELVRGIEGIDVSERELALAETLIDTMRTEWNPDAYADTYREELLRRIAEKTPAEPAHVETPTSASGARVEELMQALKASVEAAKKTKKPPSKKRPA